MERIEGEEMLAEQAEKLVCPFISTDRPDVPDWAYCLTTKCMAWFITKDHSNVRPYENLPPQECEGYCMRLYQEN